MVEFGHTYWLTGPINTYARVLWAGVSDGDSASNLGSGFGGTWKVG